MPALSALVNPVRAVDLVSLEQRVSPRHPCHLEGVSRPLDAPPGLSWGAVVKDISTKGVGLSLCYPFRPGTYLMVDLQGVGTQQRSLLARVIHVQDQHDGTWHVGCEFIKKLTESDVDLII